jgi:hypothetical protein
MIRSFILAVTLLCSTAAVAQAAHDPENDDLTPWNRFTDYALRISSTAQPGSARVHFAVDPASNDFLIDIEYEGTAEPLKEQVGMMQGRVFVSRGARLTQGLEMDAIDAPTLQLRLLLAVLTRALPGGPESITGRRRFHYTGKTGIKFATATAGGHVPLPWEASGEVTKVSDDAVSIDVRLFVPQGPLGDGAQHEQRYSGIFSKHGGPVFDDNASLDGWFVKGTGGLVLKTFGDVRARIK